MKNFAFIVYGISVSLVHAWPTAQAQPQTGTTQDTVVAPPAPAADPYAAQSKEDAKPEHAQQNLAIDAPTSRPLPVAKPSPKRTSVDNRASGPQVLSSDDAWFQHSAMRSEEYGALELRLGGYKPEAGKSFFSNDSGLLWAFEADWLPWRVPDVALVGVGFGFGWAKYSSAATALSGVTTSEKTSLTLLPMNLQAVLRCDVLPRMTGIPVVLAAKAGLDAVYWTTSTAGRTEGDGLSLGLRYGAQLAIELDFLERSAAKHLDQDWGINHVQVFFEVYRSNAGAKKSSLPVGATAWAAGLGFLF